MDEEFATGKVDDRNRHIPFALNAWLSQEPCFETGVRTQRGNTQFVELIW